MEEEVKAPEVQQSKSMQAQIQRLIDDNPVLVLATSNCPFCIEAKRTLASHGITEHFVDMDKESNYSEMRKAMTSLADNRTSVPQIWISQKHIGGCDDLKALDATGDLGLQLKNAPRHGNVEQAEEGEASASKTTGGVPADAAVITYPGPNAAYFAPFHSPATVDNRVVRVNGAITFVIAVVTAVFAEREVTQWVVLGLVVDFALKLTGFPNPIGLLSALPFAGTKPRFSAGASKQFANLCGIFFAAVAWACLVGDKDLGARIMLAILAAAAFLQGFLNFCAGCFVFEYLLKYGMVSKSVYRMHVNTRAGTVYGWEKSNVRTGKNQAPEAVTYPTRVVDGLNTWQKTTGKEVSPAAITYPTKELPPNPTDLRAKPEKEDDKWEHFHLIKYCHVNYFMVALSILGLGVPWAMLSETLGTGRGVWQALAWAGVVVQVLIGGLFLAKCALYPSKVRKEWCHPMKRNAFAVPFINFILMAWLAVRWSGASGSGDLARVLFWLGSAPLLVMALLTIGSWIATPRDEEHINAAWMIMPVGNLVGAVTARPVDSEYLEWGWFIFAVGILIWLALWPITFQRAISSPHSDFRFRSLYGIWIAPPAVAMLAYASLEELDTFDPVQRLLFYASLSMGLVLASCAWPFNFFLEGKFDMTAWSFAFPLDALAAASVRVYDYTKFDTMQVIYVVSLTAACVVNAVNMLSTLAALKGKHIFTPPGKWGPMSFMKLTHEAFREAFPMLEKLAQAATPDPADASTMRELATAWASLAKAHDIHAMHEEKVIFPELEGFFPGQTHSASEEHEEHHRAMVRIQSAIDALLDQSDGGKDTATRASLLDGLRTDLNAFGKEMLEHLDHEEHCFATPVARKYLPLSTSKKLVRSSWDATSHGEMSEFLGWVLSSLRLRGQRTRFLKTWVWAMPERGQQLGLMVYRVVNDVTWVEVARDLPEIVPRGLPGYSRYF